MCQLLCYNGIYRRGFMSLRQKLSVVLKNAKEEFGLTYKEISERSGCSITSVRYALNGGDNVGLSVFDKIFKSLKITPCVSGKYEE